MKPPTLDNESITEAQRIVRALPNELPEEVRAAAAELAGDIVAELEAARPAAAQDRARDEAIDAAITNTTSAIDRVLPACALRTSVSAKLAELAELVKGATPPAPARGTRRAGS
jgi:hypothetical protein